MKKSVLAIVLTVALSGCVYTTHTEKLNTPIARTNLSSIEEIPYSSFEGWVGEHKASIGEIMFVYEKYTQVIENKEYIRFRAPTKHNFPVSAKWVANYKYDDGTQDNLLVYTTPKYYNSSIGVILDENNAVATDKPLVQVEGAKTGRRWSLLGKGQFFGIHTNETKADKNNSWALRFGGNIGSTYEFEIVNQNESTVVDVLQTIQVSERDFLSGFTIRGIFIQGKHKAKHGVITFVASDTRV
ncbi:membrane lipoprotein lipid attachment site-containing protein [Vibrio splendidus]